MCHVITDIITSQHSSLLNDQFVFITKCDGVVLQSATQALFITKCNKVLLKSATAILLQSATSVITKCDRYYKVRQVFLQSAAGIAKYNGTHTLLRVPGVDIHVQVCPAGRDDQERRVAQRRGGP